MSPISPRDDGRKWISTFGGLAILDGTNWVTYTRSNSGLPSNNAGAVAFDSAGIAWVSTFGGGLARFDGQQWTVYSTSKSPIPHANLWYLLIDQNDVKWIATDGGLARLDGTTWKVYRQGSSRLPDSVLYTLALDRYGNLWIGTQDNGVAVFREGGVILRPQMKSSVWDAQGRLVLRWDGGSPMYQVQSRASLDTGNWENHGPAMEQQTLTVDAIGSSRFFRVTDSQP